MQVHPTSSARPLTLEEQYARLTMGRRPRRKKVAASSQASSSHGSTGLGSAPPAGSPPAHAAEAQVAAERVRRSQPSGAAASDSCAPASPRPGASVQQPAPSASETAQSTPSGPPQLGRQPGSAEQQQRREQHKSRGEGHAVLDEVAEAAREAAVQGRLAQRAQWQAAMDSDAGVHIVVECEFIHSNLVCCCPGVPLASVTCECSHVECTCADCSCLLSAAVSSAGWKDTLWILSGVGGDGWRC